MARTLEQDLAEMGTDPTADKEITKPDAKKAITESTAEKIRESRVDDAKCDIEERLRYQD